MSSETSGSEPTGSGLTPEMLTGAGEGEPALSLSAESQEEFQIAHDLSPAPPPTLATFGKVPGGRETPGYLLDVRLTLSVEVGRVQMPVREVMELGPGSIVELQRAAGEPVEIFANGRCIGHGEIVVVGDQFGVRIGELGGSLQR